MNTKFLGLQIDNYINWKNHTEEIIPMLSGACYTVRSMVHISNINTLKSICCVYYEIKSKGIPQQAEVAQGVPGRLRPRIITTFSTTRVVDCQPNALATFTPGEIPGTHFQRLSRPQGTWFCRKEPRKKIPSDTTGDRSQDHLTSSAAP